MSVGAIVSAQARANNKNFVAAAGVAKSGGTARIGAICKGRMTQDKCEGD